MSNIVFLKEEERKFLISSFSKSELWDKEHIVYQWYLEKTKEGSTKIKIVFSLRDVRCIFVCVKKTKLQDGSNDKEIKYLNRDDIPLESLVGCPFIAKRRAIKGEIYLDHFLRSNGHCDYLLEIEKGSAIQDAAKLGVKIESDVTDDLRYDNANMTTIFEDSDLKKVKYLLSLIPGFV